MRDLDSAHHSENATFRVGVLPFTGISIVAEVLARAGKRYPDASLSVMDGSYEKLLSALRIGEIDVIVGALGSPPATDVVEELLFFEERQAVCRAGLSAFEAEAGPGLKSPSSIGLHPGRGRPRVCISMRCWDQLSRTRPPRMIETGSFSVLRELLLRSDRLARLSGSYPRGYKGRTCFVARLIRPG